MKTHIHKRRWLTGFGILAVLLAGCTEQVGRSKTTTKETVETPSGKTTTTETREKDTRIDPK